MRLYIDSMIDNELHVDLRMEDGHRGVTFPGAESTVIQLKFGKESRDALKALYVLLGYESGSIFSAIEDIAAEAFRAGQKMTKYIQK